MAAMRLGLFAISLIFALSLISSLEASPQKLRVQPRPRNDFADRLLDAIAREADGGEDDDYDGDVHGDDGDDDDDAGDVHTRAADTSAKIRRLIELGKREPFFGGFLNGLTAGLQNIAQNTAGALGLARPSGQDRGKGSHGGRPRPTSAPAPAVLPDLAGAAGAGLSSIINGLVGGGSSGGGGGGAGSGGMTFPSQPVMPSGVVTISPATGASGAGDYNPAPMTRPDIDPISGVNITCPILHTFRLENCGKSQDACSLDGSMPCKRGSICCPTMNCNLQCVFPEDSSPRRGRCPISSRPAIEHALFSGVIEPQSCYFDDHCPADFKCCGPLPLNAGGEPRRYYKGARQVGATGGEIDESMFETKLCFPAENSKKPIG